MSDDLQTVVGHAVKALSKADLVETPFPYIVVDDIFPDPFYQKIVDELPALNLFKMDGGFGSVKIETSDPSFQQMPKSSREFWRRFDQEVKAPICLKLLDIFAPVAVAKAAQLFGDFASEKLADAADEKYQIQRGIIQCRTQGHDQGPHIDKATTVFTYLFYFSPDESLKPFGTILYDIEKKEEMVQAYRDRAQVRVWFLDFVEFGIEKKTTLEFRGNRLVAFANLAHSAHGAHTGASVPRYSMQNYCEFPQKLALNLFEGWKDNLAPDGVYRGGL